MTLIITNISKFGIIHASDSNLTSKNGSPAGTAKKTFEIRHLMAGLTVAGAYSVGGKRLDEWMTEFIESQERSGTGSLGDFAHELKIRLEKQMWSEEKEKGSIAHIAGYVQNKGVFHPEFWFVRNVHDIDRNTGEYTRIGQRFKADEHFWRRDCPKSKLMRAFQRGIQQIHVNGFASGRISFVMLQPVVNKFFNSIWSNSKWKFRPPRSVDEAKLLVELQLQIIGTLFHLSDYSAEFIGGVPQTSAIPQPKNIVATC